MVFKGNSMNSNPYCTVYTCIRVVDHIDERGVVPDECLSYAVCMQIIICIIHPTILVFDSSKEFVYGNIKSLITVKDFECAALAKVNLKL